jgi:adenylate cyclase
MLNPECSWPHNRFIADEGAAQRLSQRTRRLAAIMFTDMVGYTALGQQNESLSLTVLEEQRRVIRRVISEHNGREVKTMGDAFLVELPSALDAIRCAYDSQRAVREFNISAPEEKRIHLRVGLHVGDIIESQGDISGDAVNVASRIEPLAEDGGVCLTRQVYDQVHGKFELPLTSLGPKTLKNVGVPVEVFRMEMPWEKKELPHESKENDMRRIAVLPFANMSPDPNDEYFADGMTEELITSLSGVSELVVIARTSIMRYKGGTKSASEIARDLKVGTLVEGSVRKSASRIRIAVQLVDARNEGHIWAQSYDRQMDDIFAIQSDVARQVARALQVKLLSSEQKRLDRMPTSNIEAYTLYLKGRYYTGKSFGNLESLKRAIAYCEEAVANDPEFALAYAQIAWCYSQLGFFGMTPSEEAGAKAREYAEKALSLDDSLAEAHHALGRALRNFDWDFLGAQREFERAIELNPSFAEAYCASAFLLLFDRQFDEGVAKVKYAVELDPISWDVASYAGTVFLYSGRYEEAAEQFRKVLEDNPESSYARNNLGLAYIQSGMLESGLAEMKRAGSLESPVDQADLAYALGRCGRFDELRSLLDRLLAAVNHNPALEPAVASAYASLGDVDRAVEWLEKAFKNRTPALVSYNADFVFDSIRGDPRFQQLMKNIGWKNTT